MTCLEMERRAAEWLGLDKNDPKFRRRAVYIQAPVQTIYCKFCPPEEWTPPAYGSDLNLWPPIYAELARREMRAAYVCHLMAKWRDDPADSVTFYNYLLGLAAEDRLRALIAVIGEGDKLTNTLDSVGEPEQGKQ